MHNNTPLSHPKLATFGFYAKSTEAIYLYIEAIFYAVGNFLYFMFGQFLLQICASGVLFCIVLVLEFF